MREAQVEKPGLLKEYLSLPIKGKFLVLARLFRDPRVPLGAKLVLPPTLLYILMPIDIIPDFIPVLGYLDDLLVITLGLGLFLRLCPHELVREHIERYRGG
ncbi:MAG: DUF1232 domain-containing protein [Dehalococcoidia bacterium]|nr:DUF1232 domain-containing protein [Dehalococcoidia bacterium]